MRYCPQALSMLPMALRGFRESSVRKAGLCRLAFEHRHCSFYVTVRCDWRFRSHPLASRFKTSPPTPTHVPCSRVRRGAAPLPHAAVASHDDSRLPIRPPVSSGAHGPPRCPETLSPITSSRERVLRCHASAEKNAPPPLRPHVSRCSPRGDRRHGSVGLTLLPDGHRRHARAASSAAAGRASERYRCRSSHYSLASLASALS